MAVRRLGTVLAQGVRRAVAVVRGVPGPGRTAAAAGRYPTATDIDGGARERAGEPAPDCRRGAWEVPHRQPDSRTYAFLVILLWFRHIATLARTHRQCRESNGPFT